jgi:hypothetical protein
MFLLALIVAGALPALAQSGELGIIVGGSRRFVDGADKEDGVEFIESNFSFSENSFDLFWAIPVDGDTRFKLKAGRIESPVSFAYELPGDSTVYRRDVEGEVQHVEAGVEYRFSEVFGSTALFAGLGLYRQTGPDFDSTTNAGASFGVNADFPLTRRYGIVVDGTYHWVRADFQPRYLTLGAGLRISF